MLLLGRGCIYGIAICTVISSREGPSALYLLVLLFFWNAAKFIWTGPVSLVELLRVRAQERRRHDTARSDGAFHGETHEPALLAGPPLVNDSRPDQA